MTPKTEREPQSLRLVRRTLLTTPVLGELAHLIARGILRVAGWHPVLQHPPYPPKAVFVAGGHSSNWDFILSILSCLALRLDIHWMGKHTLFPPVFGAFMRWIGGIPVNRSRGAGAAKAAVDAFAENEHMYIVIAPEGTRSYTKTWKRGFYYIAEEAKVPLVLGFLDFKKKEGGLGPILEVTGDQERDMEFIRAFYEQVHPARPELVGPIILPPRRDQKDAATSDDD